MSSFSYSKRKAASKKGRRMARARWDRPQLREISADDARRLDLLAEKGQVVREGVTFRGDGSEVAWCVRRSVRGRVNQLDVVAAGRVVTTAGQRRVRKLLLKS